jgi:thiamine biosynthesis protein ThiS
MITLTINGETRNTQVVSLDALFAELGLAAPLMLVEYNGIALTRSEWSEIRLQEGDCLELMAVSAGG